MDWIDRLSKKMKFLILLTTFLGAFSYPVKLAYSFLSSIQRTNNIQDTQIEEIAESHVNLKYDFESKRLMEKISKDTDYLFDLRKKYGGVGLPNGDEVLRNHYAEVEKRK